MESQASPTVSMSPWDLTKAGSLPFWNEPVRFAIGDPNGNSSNAWRVWMQGAGDLYLTCRDTFTEMKVSLHISGRWRFGFTSEAAAARPDLFAPDDNRAMEVWDKPAEIAEGVIQAFKVYFPTTELRVTLEKRVGRKWKEVIFIEEGPPPVATVMVIYVTTMHLLHVQGIRAFTLGSWSLPDGTFAHLVAQAEPFDNEQALDEAVARAKAQAKKAGIEIPEVPCYQLWGKDAVTGARWTIIIGDR